MCQHSNVKLYENIYGVKLKLLMSSNFHDEVIEEIVLESQPFQFQKWLTYTVLITAILLHVGIHQQHAATLTVICSVFIITFFAKLHWKVTKGLQQQVFQMKCWSDGQFLNTTIFTPWNW